MQVTKKILIWIVVAWMLLMLVNYYYVNFFILAFELLGLYLLFFLLSIIQIIKLIKERKTLSSLRVQKAVVFIGLFSLTFFGVSNQIIEKIDWSILFNRRKQIVEQVKSKQLNPNVSWNGFMCKLPYEFPVVSNGGNYIEIFENQKNRSTTVKFYIFANFFESPSTYFIYTDDPEEIPNIEKWIKKYPSDNWKICENWFRTEVGPYDGL
jgi:hypothetical protein